MRKCEYFGPLLQEIWKERTLFFYDIANSYLIGMPAYPMKLLCKKRDHEWNLRDSASVDVFEVEFPRGPFKSGHKPQAQTTWLWPMPYLLKLLLPQKKKNTSKQKTNTKNFDPPKGFRGERASIGDIGDMKREACRLRSTFQQCEALCLQPSGPPESCDKKMLWKNRRDFFDGQCWIWSWTLNFGRICLHKRFQNKHRDHYISE